MESCKCTQAAVFSCRREGDGCSHSRGRLGLANIPEARGSQFSLCPCTSCLCGVGGWGQFECSDCCLQQSSGRGTRWQRSSVVNHEYRSAVPRGGVNVKAAFKSSRSLLNKSINLCFAPRVVWKKNVKTVLLGVLTWQGFWEGLILLKSPRMWVVSCLKGTGWVARVTGISASRAGR